MSPSTILWINDNPISGEAKSRLQRYAGEIFVEVLESKYFAHGRDLNEGVNAVREKIKAALGAGARSVSLLTDSHIFGRDNGGFHLLRGLESERASSFNRGIVCSVRVAPPPSSDSWAEFDRRVIPLSGSSDTPPDWLCAQIVRFFKTGHLSGLSLASELITRVQSALHFLREGFRAKPSLKALDGWRNGVGSRGGFGTIELFGTQRNFADYYKESLPESLGVPMENRPKRLEKWSEHWHNWRHAFCPFQSLYAAANEPWPDERLLNVVWMRNLDKPLPPEVGTRLSGGAIRTLTEIDALRAYGSLTSNPYIARTTSELDGVQRDWVRLQYERLGGKLENIDSKKIWFVIEQADQECGLAQEMVKWLRDNGVKE
jgi:hypothetical protein